MIQVRPADVLRAGVWQEPALRAARRGHLLPQEPVVKIQDGVELGNLLFTKAPSSGRTTATPTF